MHKVLLKNSRDYSLIKLHPWVFSGAIQRAPEGIKEGDLVEVCASDGAFRGIGFWGEGSIAVKVLSFEKCEINQNFWDRKISQAVSLRERLGLLSSKDTNCFRLVNAEGDTLPGLIVDIYGEVAVMQFHAKALYNVREELKDALLNNLKGKVKAVYLKTAGNFKAEGSDDSAGGTWLTEKSQENVVFENGFRFFVDWEAGQKTGFFLDQRENREKLKKYVQGKTVLNAFCYTGGFSIYALKAGANVVHSVDSSKPAMETLAKNIELNEIDPAHHESFTVDFFDYLKQTNTNYEVIVLDPPAFAKHRKAIEGAKRGYTRINKQAMENIKPGGILLTFSCSQVINREVFKACVAEAASQAKREVQIISELGQSSCHPSSLTHEEGGYLKGLVLFVK